MLLFFVCLGLGCFVGDIITYLGFYRPSSPDQAFVRLVKVARQNRALFIGFPLIFSTLFERSSRLLRTSLKPVPAVLASSIALHASQPSLIIPSQAFQIAGDVRDIPKFDEFLSLLLLRWTTESLIFS